MKIKKVNDTYNTYSLELGFGELTAVANALEQATPDVVTDEITSGIRWYLDNLPGPGEDKDEFKDRREAEKEMTQEPALEPSAAEAESNAAPESETEERDLDTVLPEPPPE